MAKFKTAEVAAKWWADKLDGMAKQDNGAPEMANGLGGLLMMMSSLMHKVSPEKREAFRIALESKLDESLDQIIDGLEDMACGQISLRVDYGAEGLLADVASSLGIPYGTGSAFPVKTSMAVSKKDVKLWYGYGASEQVLYKEEPTKTTPPAGGKKTDGGKNSDGGRV